jgi:hypothetical protein
VSRSRSRAALAAIALTASGLACLAPVLFTTRPVTVGLFLAGAGLVLAGVALSAALLPGLLRCRGRE